MRGLRGRSRTSDSVVLGNQNLSSLSLGAENVDKKTKQHLYLECPVCILGQAKLAANEAFTQNKAEVLMNRLYEKRQSHCVVYCLEDTLRFKKTKRMGSNPIRNFVKYKEIKHVFIFEDKPDAFMLCVDDGLPKNKSYEAYKCKRKEDVLSICELIYKASQDQDYILRGLVPIRPVSQYSDLSIPIQYHSATEIGQTSSIRAHSANSMFTEPTLVNSPKIKDGIKKLQQDRFLKSSRIEVIEARPALKIGPSPRRSSNESNDWSMNVTYIRIDPVLGAVIDDNGPIYMYVARYPRS